MAACLRRKSGRPRSFHRTERVSTPQENRTRSPYSFRLFLSIFLNGRNVSPRRAPFATARDSFAHACRNAGCARYRGIAFFEYAPASVVITASLPQPLTMPVTPAKSSPTRSHPVCYRWQRSSAKRGLPLARQHPAGLRETGVRIALDDFGTAYSSRSYLTTMPADIIKVDRSFLSREFADSSALLESIIGLA